MIVVEGGDNVGKSQLVSDLLEFDPSLHLIKRRRFRPERNETIGTSYLGCLVPENGDRTSHVRGVVDRLLASEIIYGSLFRDGSRLRDGETLAIKLALISYGAVVAWCDPPDDAILSSWIEREQLYDDPLRIADAYRRDVPSIFSSIPVFRYNYTDPDDDPELIIHVHRRYRTPRHLLSWWSAHPWGVGNLHRPMVAFVGESLSPNAVTPIPFASGPAGDFLAWAIFRANVPLNMYVTNAIKGGNVYDAALLEEELNFLQPDRVVALGKKADRICRETTWSGDYAQIPHPMYWRRFQWKRRDEYVGMIEEVMTT